MSSPDFKKLWEKKSWHEKAEILEARAYAFRWIGIIDTAYDSIIKHRKQHKSTKVLKAWLKEDIEALEKAENELQVLWGVKKDKNYHTYWLAPKACTCPKMDNIDRLGFGRIISGDCPLHGTHPCWKTKGK